MNPIQARKAEDMVKAMGNADASALLMTIGMLPSDVIKLFRAGDYQEGFSLADRGIAMIEEYIQEYPSEKNIFEFSLFELYTVKANGYTQLGQTDVNFKKQALKQIEMALNVTTNVPSEYYSTVLQLQDDLKKEISDKEKCFIATAVYGSAFVPDVEILRQFRDTRLRQNRAGRVFIYIYEHVSPPLAHAIAPHQSIRWLVRHFMLKPIVRILKMTVK